MIYIETSGSDGTEEYALTDVQFFDWDLVTKKATDLPSSLFKAAPDLLAACEDAEFLMRKIAINPKELPQMMDSIKRTAADLKEIINKAKGEQ